MNRQCDYRDLEACLERVKVTTKLPSSSYKESGKFPVVSQEKGLISGYWDNAEDVFTHNIPVTVFGDHTMVVKYIDFDFVIGADGVKVLIPKSFLLPRFFYYWVASAQITSRGYARHYRYLKEKKVPIPSFAEQQRMVGVLDAEFERIDALKGNAGRNLQNAKDLFQAALKKELTPKKGWNEMSLANMCKITSQLVDPQLDEYRSLVHIGGANIESETGKLIGLKTAAEEELSSGKFVFDSTMVLYNKIRPYLKKVARPDFNGLCSADMYPLTPSKGTNKDFLYYVLMSKDFTEYAIKGSARAGMPKVNRDCLFAYRCIVPLERVQADIALRLNSLDSHCRKLQENYGKTAALCDDLKQALLRKAFSGEL